MLRSGLLASRSRRSGPLRGSDPLQPQRSAEQERLRRTQWVRLLVSDAGETLHRHRGNLERRLCQQRLHWRTHLWVRTHGSQPILICFFHWFDYFVCFSFSFSPSSCWESVARQRRNRRPDRHLEPRPRRCGPLWGVWGFFLEVKTPTTLEVNRIYCQTNMFQLVVFIMFVIK